jgi:hypothetical protein
MIAGLILTDDVEECSSVAFLGEDTLIKDVKTNKEIVDEIADKEPEVVAVDVGTDQAAEELTEKEKELKEEGFIFTPNEFQRGKVERLQSLERHAKHEMGGDIDFIRFEPQITSQELEIAAEHDLEGLGVDADPENSKQFDAMLGAVTARFYTQGQFQDLGVVVPQHLENS